MSASVANRSRTGTAIDRARDGKEQGQDCSRSRAWPWAPILAGVTYAVLVLIVWAPYTLRSGLPYETLFPYNSENTSVWDGFLFRGDPLRIHTNTFYHLSYLISTAFGIRGSYTPYQVVYALLWWGRGLLAFLIMRRFFHRSVALCYMTGALVVMHASDLTLQWVGQMNQFGFIFWMLLGFYLLTLACEASDRLPAALYTAGACFCEHMSLWSYESQLLLVVTFPLVLVLARRRWRKPAIMAAWYSVTAVYICQSILRYSHSAAGTYQATVLRTDWHLTSLLSDWLFNIRASLAFWQWRDNLFVAESPGMLPWLAAGVFLAGGLASVILTGSLRKLDPTAESARIWWTVMVAGFAMLALSFPVYLFLASARSLWRTQLLSGLGSALVLTSLSGVAVSAFRQKNVRMTSLLACGAAITFYGSASAVSKGLFHRAMWDDYRDVMVQVVQLAPSVKPNTVVVLILPKEKKLFHDNMWFDVAVRLAYPHIPVGGVHFYADGTPGPGSNLASEGTAWRWDGTAYPPDVRSASLGNTLVIEVQTRGKARLLDTLPPFVCRTVCAAQLYNPGSVITGPVSPIAVRRFQME